MNLSRPSRRGRGLAAAAAIALLAAGCSATGSSGSGESGNGGGGDDPAASTTVPPALAAADEKGSWTVLTYIAADNNLEGAALVDIGEMMETSGTDFVVLIDRSADYSDDELGELGNFDDAALLHIRDGEMEVLDQPGEIDTSDPAVLSEFITTGLTQFPNDHHALVIWDHGGAWKGAAWDDTTGEDENLNPIETADAIGAGLAAVDGGSLDLIGFDACLMATYEVAAALSPHAPYLLASEELEPGDGWDWHAFDMAADGMTTQELGQSVIDAFQKSYDDMGEKNVTLSLVDMTKIGALDDATADLAAAMEGDIGDFVGTIGARRANAVGYGKNPAPEADYFSVDLGDLAAELATIEGMEGPAASLAAAVEQVVVSTSNGAIAAGSTGIAAYFPTAETYFDNRYEELSATWFGVLDAYYGAVDTVPDDQLPVYSDRDRFIDEQDAAEAVEESDESITLTGAVAEGTGGNVLSSTINWGEVDQRDSSQVIWFGKRSGTVDGDAVTGTYDWQYLTISDGTNTAIAYADIHLSTDGTVDRITVPITYVDSSTTYEGTLELTLDGENITAETFYLTVGGGLAAITPLAGNTFTPLLEQQDLDTGESTWIDTPAGSVAADVDLQYSYEPLPSATAVLVGLGLTDIRGDEDWVYYGTASP